LGTMLGPFVYTARIDVVDFGLASLPPSAAHPMGTDDIGRDVLARMLVGGRISIAVGISSVIASILIGMSVGALSGYFGGKLDTGRHHAAYPAERTVAGHCRCDGGCRRRDYYRIGAVVPRAGFPTRRAFLGPPAERRAELP